MKLAGLAERCGYVLIPPGALDRAYDGTNNELIEIYQEGTEPLTWWIRFFDWI